MDNIQAISEMSGRLRAYRALLDEPNALSSKKFVVLADDLDKISEVSQRIQDHANDAFSKAGALNLQRSTQRVFQDIEIIEQRRVVEDEALLEELHLVSNTVDKLALKFLNLDPDEIESTLDVLDERFKHIAEKQPYHEDVITPIYKSTQRKLNDLHFRLDFSVVDQLDENKPSFAHYIENQIDATDDPAIAQELRGKLVLLKNLCSIAKEFKYGDVSKAKEKYNLLDESTKTTIEQNVFRLTADNVDNLQKDSDFGKIMAVSIMGHVQEVVNLG